MELKLNDKIFIGRYDENGRLIIKLDNDEDIIFFKIWGNLSIQGIPKKDYVKDVEFRKVGETGTLKNCSPILNMNEDNVQINYDCIEIEKGLNYHYHC